MYCRVLHQQFGFAHKSQNLLRRWVSSSPNAHTSVTFHNGITDIVMCDTKTRNSLSLEMMKSLIANISEHEGNPKVRVIVIGAEGPVFSAGHNLKELLPEPVPEQQINVFTLAASLMNKIIDCPVPIIAKVDGLAAAAGCQLVGQCDLAFCTESSSFSTPGANFGLFCSTPGVALARAVPKSTALRMLLTGLPISGKEAELSGLVNRACANNSLDEEIEKTCAAIMSKSRTVIELGKQFYYKQITKDVKTAYEIGGQRMVDNLQLKDGQEGIKSFVEKRKPAWNE